MRAAARDRLRAAIDAHRAENGDGLDEHGHKVLDRLASDERASDAFVAVLPNGDRWNVLLSDCITANERARSHAKRICALRKRLQKAPRATKAVETIADFFDGIRSEPFDPVKQALGTLRAEINFWRRLAEEDLGTLSRKKDASAARAQGIGWLRESVLRLSRQPNQKHVIVLAQIVLETRDIDLNNVRKAVMLSDALNHKRKSVAKNVAVTSRKHKVSRSGRKNRANGAKGSEASAVSPKDVRNHP